MRISGIAAGLALLALAPASASADAEVRGGTYAAVGTNLDGSPYSGTARIKITSNSTCEIVWKTGGATSRGICMRDSDSFAAAYRMGEAVGLVIYKIAPDGSLDGVWTIAGLSGAGTETLTPQ